MCLLDLFRRTVYILQYILQYFRVYFSVSVQAGFHLCVCVCYIFAVFSVFTLGTINNNVK